jgi:ferredoxin--NADP+ reductase
VAAGQPLRVAVVGSGPAGFYAAGALLQHEEPRFEVDVIDRLPTPWGLVRLGVAPDHPKIKSVSRAFEKIAQRPGFRFFGNVEVGRDIGHEELAALYDAVVYAVGAQSDRRMGIPGEDLPGSWPATAFVAWYNGHPDFQDISFDLSSERAVVVGNGNVAVDVARMLALTAEEIEPTDTTDDAIAAILGSGIREILVLGRRGPAQAAFTSPELQELREMAGADLDVDAEELELDPESMAALETDTAIARRNIELLHEAAATPPSGKPKTVKLRFCVSPVAILGEDRVEAVEVVRNELVADAQGRIRAVPTEEREVLPCGIVLRSVGYRGVALPGIPFDDETDTIRNDRGRVLAETGEPLAGIYCTGWIKRGPSGVIGTNKKDATETVELLLEDAAARLLPSRSGGDIAKVLAARGVTPVTHEGWEAIDTLERARGEEQGRHVHRGDPCEIAADNPARAQSSRSAASDIPPYLDHDLQGGSGSARKEQDG